MKLRISVGFGMLALLCYYLVADSTFRAEFFTVGNGAVPILVVIGAFILSDRFAWPLQAVIAAFCLLSLLLPDNSSAPGANTIPSIALAIVFALLSWATYKNGRKTAKLNPSS